MDMVKAAFKEQLKLEIQLLSDGELGCAFLSIYYFLPEIRLRRPFASKDSMKKLAIHRRIQT